MELLCSGFYDLSCQWITIIVHGVNTNKMYVVTPLFPIYAYNRRIYTFLSIYENSFIDIYCDFSIDVFLQKVIQIFWCMRNILYRRLWLFQLFPKSYTYSLIQSSSDTLNYLGLQKYRYFYLQLRFCKLFRRTNV